MKRTRHLHDLEQNVLVEFSSFVLTFVDLRWCVFNYCEIIWRYFALYIFLEILKMLM